VSYGLQPHGYSFHKLYRVPIQRLEKSGTFWRFTPMLLDHPVAPVHSGYRVMVPHVRYRHLVKEYLDLKPFDTLPRVSQADVVFARNG
jgi:hypothetical protein